MHKQYNKASKHEAGDWQGLDASTQIPRYSTIAEILHSFRADRKVLDVGCGEALLHAWLPKDADYTGIEPSDAAITRITLDPDSKAKIIHTSAERFEVYGEFFDSIVFNEMLYYAADPVGLLRKYATFVPHGGVILCSIYQKPGNVSLRCRLRRFLDPRRSLSNVHCEKMVRAFMLRKAWPILDDRVIAMPGSSSGWHIWLAKPH